MQTLFVTQAEAFPTPSTARNLTVDVPCAETTTLGPATTLPVFTIDS